MHHRARVDADAQDKPHDHLAQRGTWHGASAHWPCLGWVRIEDLAAGAAKLDGIQLAADAYFCCRVAPLSGRRRSIDESVSHSAICETGQWTGRGRQPTWKASSRLLWTSVLS